MRKIAFVLSWLTSAGVTIAGAQQKITVSAGDFDRQQTVVNFRFKSEVPAFHRLRDASGKVYPLQVDPDGECWFVVGQLKKGTRATYDLLTEPADAETKVAGRRANSKLRLTLDRKPVLEYQAEPSELPRPDIDPVFQRGAYLHPVATLSGKIITDHYPPNHLHQDGIFFSWTKTEFQGRQPDFWNLKDKKGRVEFVRLGKSWDGPVQGGFTSQHRFVDLTGGSPTVALNETWLVRVYNNPSKSCWIFDLTSTQTCAGANALKLPQYHYGGFGFRGNWAWNGKDACSFLTSEGETDRLKGNGAQGRWCDIWGRLEGADAGIAILGHPSNFRAPQPLRLHPTEPYLSFAPQQAGDFEIAPAQVYVTRFRFAVHDGQPDKAELDRLWNDYANPPVVVEE